MLFITGPLYSGKRTFAKPFGGRQIYEVQTLAANAESLPALADELAQYDVVTATEVGRQRHGSRKTGRRTGRL